MFFPGFYAYVCINFLTDFNLRGLTLQAGSKYTCINVPESLTLPAAQCTYYIS